MSEAATSPFPLGKIAVIGCGLIGSSILRACIDKNLAESFATFDSDPHVKGVIGNYWSPSLHPNLFPANTAAPTETSLAAVTNADLIFLSIPIDQMERIAEEILPALSPGAVVTDVGSVKGPVVEKLTSILGKRFVGGHPMAGRETSGFSFDPNLGSLFENQAVLLTPTDNTSIKAHALVSSFWKQVGGIVESLSPEEHDRRIARVSHLPHLAAAALASIVKEEKFLKVAGTGFRDTTRIAAGRADMWREILLENRQEVIIVLKEFITELQDAQRALEEGRGNDLQSLLKRANDTRLNLAKIEQIKAQQTKK